MTSTVLVTGGLGFIGSHTAVELLEYGHDIPNLDNPRLVYSHTVPAYLLLLIFFVYSLFWVPKIILRHLKRR
jgi:UDP-glucose 4-epimerase